MAERVERIINNKFYFVLDEVGASDCESEVGCEDGSKEINRLGQKNDESSKFDENSIDVINIDKDENNIKIKDIDIQEPTHSKLRKLSPAVDVDGSFKNEELKSKVLSHLPSNQKFSPPQVEEIRLKECTKIIDVEIDTNEKYEKSTPPDVHPLVRVMFRDEAVQKLLKGSLTKLFSQKFENCIITTNDENSLELEVFDKNLSFENDLVGYDLDTTPTHSNYCDAPHYGKNHDFLLSDKSLEKQKSKKLFASSYSSCFNCQGAHNLRDCPEAKDFKKINKNRLMFLSQVKNTKSSRYHLDEAQKFSDIVPGAISKKLRNALNLHHDQQPSFIYRMRLLGYPPAWLEEAKVSHSGVVMYDSTGIPVLEEDEEEGEILPEGAKDRFDISKIIEFPGFNVPLPNNFKDETKLYGCPDISEDQSKQNLIKLLEPKTVEAYVKKSLLKSDEKSLDKGKRAASPTIEEMEEKKRQLLMELDEESSCVLKLNFEDSSSSIQNGLESTQNIQNKEPGTVKNLEFGTPILKNVSPFSKLPTREQFSSNISDVINFENLPNSTGKYESMRHVITKIRTSTSKIQNK